MKTPVCPRCNSVLIQAREDGHFSCPSCDLYLSAWAYPTLKAAFDRHDPLATYGEGNEVTAAYAIPTA